jgi:CRISPR-associated exonuclease Cas4
MMATPWVAIGAMLALVLGLLLVLGGRGMRRRRGLAGGKTVSLDNVTLTSHRLGLTGRPDRLIKVNGTIIPEEWKSSRKVWPSHRAQLGVAFVVIEDQYGVRPTHGFVVLGDGTRERVENTEELRAFVLDVAARIRAARAALRQPIVVDPRPGQCRACGMRAHCAEARA